MRRRTFGTTILWLAAALVLASGGLTTSGHPVAAESLGDFFAYSYQAQLSKAEVSAGESFSAFVQGEATTKVDLPVSPSKAEVTTRVVARHQSSGSEVILNSGYTVTIQPFPARKGDRVEIQRTVPLQFPVGSEPGSYQVVGELERATVTVAGVAISVTQYLPQSQVLGAVTCVDGTCPPGGAGGRPPAQVPPGTTVLTGLITSQGTFMEAVTAYSHDEAAWLTIPRGTVGLRADGTPLLEITMVEFSGPPSPPAGTTRVAPVYDLGPDGAIFNPPITLTMRYDPALLPEGADPEKLVIVAWDKSQGKWVELKTTVDTAGRTISAPVSHFSAFTGLVPSRLAAFTAGDLRISPVEVDVGEEVLIRALVTNTGDLRGSHLVTLKIDNRATASQEVTLAGGASEEVTFTVTVKAAGTYRVAVDTLTGTLVVKEVIPVGTPEAPAIKPKPFILSELTLSPADARVGETVQVGVTITNIGESRETIELVLKIDGVAVQSREVALDGGKSSRETFTVAAVTPGTFTVSIDRLSGQLTISPALPATPPSSPTTPPALQPPQPVNWPLAAGALAAFVVLVTVLWILLRRRRA